jgi:hypothetical protein
VEFEGRWKGDLCPDLEDGAYWKRWGKEIGRQEEQLGEGGESPNRAAGAPNMLLMNP